MPTPLKALIFDVDGTLADTERDGHRPAFNQAFQSLGLDWEWDIPLYGKLLAITGGKERILHYLDQYRPDFQRPRNLMGFITELHKTKTRCYTEMLAQGGIPLRPGVARLIQEARQIRIPLAIATTTTPENVTALLAHTLGPDSPAWFQVIGAGDVVPAKKPAPDIYHWVLERLNLTPEQCLAFEDSENGIRASLAAGVPTVITINDYTAQHDFTGAVAVLSDLGEPNAPFRVLQGNPFNHQYVDWELSQQWHQAG